MAQLKPLIAPAGSTTTPDLHRFFHRVENEAEGKAYYSREFQVQVHLDNVVKDVIRSCKYELKTDTEAALNGLKVDVGIIRNQNGAVGTMEVKQPRRQNVSPPDPDPMVHPKVVTQVCSQMIPLRTMYGVKNVYGILSTYSSWRFFRWVPAGEDDDGLEDAGQMLEDLHVSTSAMKENPFITPRKSRSELDVEKARNSSPPMSPKPYCDDDADQSEEDDEEEEDDSTDECQRGTLYASNVISDGPLALKMLAWVLGEMNRSPVEHLPAHKRDNLYVVQKDALGGYENIPHETSFYKGRMPNAINGKLYFLEELGHRHHGRVYRAMSKNGNLCVLKYFVKSQHVLNENGKRVEVDAEGAASKSVQYWNKAYNKWLPSATCGKWGGGHAIIMPDLEKMSVAIDPSSVWPMLKDTMKKRYFEQDLWHGDPAWRNVALVRDKAGNMSKVCMIDLEPARMVEKVEASKWKDFTSMWTEFKNRLEQDWENFKAGEKH